MLGRLAKKLRILGFDTLYYNEIEEDEILKLSKGRILLTRDKMLERKAKKQGINVFYIKSDKWRSQLKAVNDRFSIEKFAKPFTRCSECNGELVEAEREKVKDKVPEYIYKTTDKFMMCKNCGKVYWKGSHISWIVSDVGKLVEVWKKD